MLLLAPLGNKLLLLLVLLLLPVPEAAGPRRDRLLPLLLLRCPPPLPCDLGAFVGFSGPTHAHNSTIGDGSG
jgi:hypothetical protein